MSTRIVDVDRVVIRFAGDSGDGMQLTGDRFTTSSALFGNDLSTLPDFPAEIRAPAGTLAGVSAFQVHISDHDILTPGDHPERAGGHEPGGPQDQPGRPDRRRDHHRQQSTPSTSAPWPRPATPTNPLTDGSLSRYTVYEVPMTSLTLEAVKPSGTKPRDAERSKNFFALGLISWLYTRPTEPTLEWIQQRFGKTPMVAEANTLAFKAGWNFGETAELFPSTYEVKPAPLEPGAVHQHLGQHRPGLGPDRGRPAGQAAALPRAATRSRRPRTSSTSCPSTRTSASAPSRPRTRSPASAPPSVRPSPARSGSPRPAARASTSSPRPSAWPSASSCRCSIIDIQRGGPSTGLPTKTEQADLLQAMFGRHGEAPVPIVAPCTPGDCFFAAIEAARIAVKYRTPVFLLSDGYLANGAEPWRIPDVDVPARHQRPVRDRAQPRRRGRRPPSSGPTCATPRPWPGRGPSPVRPG